MPKVTFNWEINIGTVTILAGILINAIIISTLLMNRVSLLEKGQNDVKNQLDSVHTKVTTLETIVSERTSRKPIL